MFKRTDKEDDQMIKKYFLLILLVIPIVLFSGCIEIPGEGIKKTVTVSEILGQSYEYSTPYGRYFGEEYYIRFTDGYYGSIVVRDCPFLRVGDNVTARFIGNKMVGYSLECPEERK